jgi:hypothetical protein
MIPPFLNGLLNASLALLISFAAGQALISGQLEFALITLLITAYSVAETSRVLAVQNVLWLVNTIVQCLLTFFPFLLGKYVLRYCLLNGFCSRRYSQPLSIRITNSCYWSFVVP